MQRQIVEGAYSELYERLARNGIRVSLTANVQTFSVFGGDPVDLNEDGIVDNEHGSKGWDVATGVAYSLSSAASLSANVHYGRRRASASADSDMQVYRGLSGAFAVRVATLNSRYKTTEDYRKSLFIPAVVLGVGAETERCRGAAASCEDTVTRRTVVTPFLDFRVTPGAQFRIAVPWSDTTQLTQKTKQLTALAQIAVQLSSLK